MDIQIISGTFPTAPISVYYGTISLRYPPAAIGCALLLAHKASGFILLADKSIKPGDVIHILLAKGIAGRITYNPDAPAQSTGQISIPVEFLEVDDPKERAREGLSGELNESNRASVRENMLGADQLDASAFPRITAALEGVTGKPPELRLQVRVRIRKREQLLAVPVTVTETGEMLTVQGEVTLLQSAFGITPYVALFGAIAVQDAVRVRFELIARPLQP